MNKKKADKMKQILLVAEQAILKDIKHLTFLKASLEADIEYNCEKLLEVKQKIEELSS